MYIIIVVKGESVQTIEKEDGSIFTFKERLSAINWIETAYRKRHLLLRAVGEALIVNVLTGDAMFFEPSERA